MMKRLLMVLGSLALVAPTNAADVAVTGIGYHTCADYIVAAQGIPIGSVHIQKDKAGQPYQSEKSLFLEWARGYISGVNEAQPTRQLRMDTTNVLEVSFLNYCNKHPTNEFYFAARNFLMKEGILDPAK